MLSVGRLSDSRLCLCVSVCGGVGGWGGWGGGSCPRQLESLQTLIVMAEKIHDLVVTKYTNRHTSVEVPSNCQILRSVVPAFAETFGCLVHCAARLVQ
jgi:hypothetical protein